MLEMEQQKYPVPTIQGEEARVRLGIDLTLCPQDWLPKVKNERISFTARIYTFNEERREWEYRGEAGEKRAIKFSFKDVSKEPGICMNFPAIDQANENPDLFFPDDGDNAGNFTFSDDETDAVKTCPTEIENPNDNAQHNHHYKTATTTEAVSEATIEVRSEDYGAYGTLEASAPDCETLEPRGGVDCSQNEGPNDVKIPRDANGNHIADSAPHDGGGAADKDEDNYPYGDGTRGDGLTNYEEYRGFIVKIGQGKGHTRTSIDRKDIFIRDRDGLGTGYFSESGLEIHLIPGAEYYGGDSPDDPTGRLGTSQPRRADDRTQVINFNSKTAHGGDQRGLRLVRGDLQSNTRSVSGFTFATDGKNPGPPGNINRVAINRDYIIARGIDHKLEKTIAHELGHAVCIKHHGDFRMRLLDHNHEVAPYGQGPSDRQKGVTSGDNSCVMRYDNVFTYWCNHYYVKFFKAPCIHTIYDPRNNGREALPHPLTFCGSDTGTGVNDQNNCGCTNNAKLGNCKSQIRVKDW
jgi:hypothetical protein